MYSSCLVFILKETTILFLWLRFRFFDFDFVFDIFIFSLYKSSMLGGALMLFAAKERPCTFMCKKQR